MLLLSYYNGGACFLFFKRLVVQGTQLLRKMMEGMRLSSEHCAAKSTPPNFVLHVWKIIA